MKGFRCKCGQTVVWSSMGVRSCETCPECGSDLAMGAGLHRDPVPHEWVTRYDPNTGEPYEMCKVCFKRREKPAQDVTYPDAVLGDIRARAGS